MMAALRSFCLLWLPGLLLLLGGLSMLLRTGQVDPVSWAWPAIILIPAAYLVARRGTWPLFWMGAGAVLTVGLTVWRAAEAAPSVAAMGWIILIILLAMSAGACLAVRRMRAGIALVALMLVACWLATGRREASLPAATRPVLGVISGLPLFWKEESDGMNMRADAPIVTVLRRHFDIRPLDDPSRLGATRTPLLLLAQPRALLPEELVAIDNWVRDGGRALVLADPLLRWPSSLPWGDRRRPPATSLLGPLLERWGARLMPAALEAGERGEFLNDGRMVTVYAASVFRPVGSNCRPEAEGLVMRCAVGKGAAVLIADADLIDDRLWLADPARPDDERQWVADNPQWLIDMLGGEAGRQRRWIRSEAALMSAIRWAILFGTVWAALGMALIGRFGVVPEPVTGRLEKGRKLAEP